MNRQLQQQEPKTKAIDTIVCIRHKLARFLDYIFLDSDFHFRLQAYSGIAIGLGMIAFAFWGDFSFFAKIPMEVALLWLLAVLCLQNAMTGK